jgi:hypothetical protein
VDVVGDIHELSHHFAPESFDVVYAASVFEHLAMPWKAILEINRVIRVGGLFFVTTHPTWPAHETPWDFWRFSKEALGVLVGPVTGFTVIRCEEGLSCLVLPFQFEPAMLGLHRESAYLGVSMLAEKCGPPDERLSWDIGISEVIDSVYPRE